MFIPGIGLLQDAGVRANCPLQVAIRETRDMWPTNVEPSLVVSVGTGFSLTPKGSQRQGFIHRALHAFIHGPAVDGYEGFQDAYDNLPRGARELTGMKDSKTHMIIFLVGPGKTCSGLISI